MILRCDYRIQIRLDATVTKTCVVYHDVSHGEVVLTGACCPEEQITSNLLLNQVVRLQGGRMCYRLDSARVTKLVARASEA
jgi:hypothetical protein